MKMQAAASRRAFGLKNAPLPPAKVEQPKSGKNKRSSSINPMVLAGGGAAVFVVLAVLVLAAGQPAPPPGGPVITEVKPAPRPVQSAPVPAQGGGKLGAVNGTVGGANR
jgi:hypothetical protein